MKKIPVSITIGFITAILCAAQGMWLFALLGGLLNTVFVHEFLTLEELKNKSKERESKGVKNG